MNVLNKILILIISLFTFISCAPKLTFTEIKEKINKNYEAFNENDVEYEFNNTPTKLLKEYGEDGYRNKLEQVYELRKNSKNRAHYDKIGALRIQEINNCNSTYFYKAKYTIDKVQVAPYLDSITLERNFQNYGRKNVNFNTNSKMLEIREQKEGLLIFDKDKNWKFITDLNFDEEILNRLYGKEFSKCVKSKVEKSVYLPYW